ncbi:MAG: DUF2442 domain-containing protein [Chloroflexi bacterium]|nr:DUF2442 domain-containing protein [Chloroflexota bacterium]
MLTSTERVMNEVSAVSVRFYGDTLSVSLSDDRQISIPLDKVEWLHWLLKATPEQRDKWHIEPGGYAVYWDQLDDGVEVRHLLSMEHLA